MLQCKLAFARSPSLFPNHSAKITFIVNALKGRTLCWAQAYLSSHSPETLTSELFLKDFCNVFDHLLHQETTAKCLITLRQGNKSAADFRIAAEEVEWDKLALRGIYINSLSETIKDQLTPRDDTKSLDNLITLSIRIDNRLKERKRERNYNTHNSLIPTLRLTETEPITRTQQNELEPEPMQVGRTRLTPEECQRRFDKVCIYCGNKGHFVATRPIQGNGLTRQCKDLVI